MIKIIKSNILLFSGISLLLIIGFVVGNSFSSLPKKVTNFAATYDKEGIKLYWTYPYEDVKFNIYRSQIANVLGKKLNKEPLSQNYFIDREVEKGIYFYTIKPINEYGEGEGSQYKIEIYPQIKNLSMNINNNAKYTNNLDVLLYISGENIDFCRFKNDEDKNWTEWEEYKGIKKWRLSFGGDGIRTVLAECKNNASQFIVMYPITLDRTPPQVFLLDDGKVIVRDQLSSKVYCNIFVDGETSKLDVKLENGKGEFSIDKKGTVSLSCSDEANNVQVVPPKRIE